MRMLASAHDSLGHRGAYATKMLIAKCFWWPEYERWTLVLPVMPGTTEDNVENPSYCYAYTIFILKTACGHYEYVTKIQWVWAYCSWLMWNDFLDGRLSIKRRNREISRDMVI